jgi:Tfp pilus assembly protein PilF
MGGSRERAREQAVEIRKRDSLAGHRAFAELAVARKELGAARAEYAAAIAEAPLSAQPHFFYGIYLMLEEKNYKAAAGEFDAALRIDRSNMPARFQIGHLSALSGTNLERGEAELRIYLAHQPAFGDPPIARAHYWLGVVYEKLGRGAEARGEFQAALRLRPADSEAKQALKRVS